PVWPPIASAQPPRPSARPRYACCSASSGPRRPGSYGDELSDYFGVRWPQPPLLYATERGPRPSKAVAAATALQTTAPAFRSCLSRRDSFSTIGDPDLDRYAAVGSSPRVWLSRDRYAGDR